MDTRIIIYRGNARVYLQGIGALQPVDISTPECYTYFLGAERSAIKIKDHRPEPNCAALIEIENKANGEFADAFNQPAEVEIVENESDVEIQMLPTRQDTDTPILWMGVLYDGKMPVHHITWEALKPISDTAIAFVVLVAE